MYNCTRHAQSLHKCNRLIVNNLYSINLSIRNKWSNAYNTHFSLYVSIHKTLQCSKQPYRTLFTTVHKLQQQSSSNQQSQTSKTIITTQQRSNNNNNNNRHQYDRSYSRAELRQRNIQLAQYGIAFVIFFIGMGYASVPLYRMFCRVTGYGGTVQQDQLDVNFNKNRNKNEHNDDNDNTVDDNTTQKNRDITISFTADVGSHMHWDFYPTQPSLTIRVGEPTLAFFTAKNKLDSAITGVATYNVTPMKAGLYFHKIQCFCVSAGTVISMPNGLGVVVEDSGNVGSVLSYDDSSNSVVVSVKSRLYDQGIKQCVCLTLEDGRKLRCTPDHRVLTLSGWKQVDELEMHNKMHAIVCGVDCVHDSVDDIEKMIESRYSIQLHNCGIKLDMSTWNQRQRTLAFARLAGLLLSDGSVHHHRVNNVTNAVLLVRHQIDVDALMYDLTTLGVIQLPSVSHHNNVYQVILSDSLTRDLLLWTGDKRRNNQPIGLPKLLTSYNTPYSVKREFVSAYFGGGGDAPCLAYSNYQYLFDSITFHKLVHKHHLSKAVSVINELNQVMHDVFGMQLGTVNIVESTTVEHAEIRLDLSSLDTLLYAERVGFRYNCDKQMRLTVAAAWYRMQGIMSVASMTTIPEWLDSIDASQVFTNPHQSSYTTQYDLSHNNKSLPVFYLTPIDLTVDQLLHTYDISVYDTHNFLANGCVAHNCFDEQRLRPGEEIDMPVFFYIDNEFLQDKRMKDVNNIVLSYTFWPTEVESEEEQNIINQAVEQSVKLRDMEIEQLEKSKKAQSLLDERTEEYNNDKHNQNSNKIQP